MNEKPRRETRLRLLKFIIHHSSFIILLSLATCHLPLLLGQNPAMQTAPVFRVNAQYANGVAPGYAPTKGSGLTLNLSAATANCGSGATTTASGAVAVDSTANNLHAGLAAADSIVPTVTTTPADGDCAKWSISGGRKKLDTTGAPCGAGGGGSGVNSGTIGQFGYYAAAGSTISGSPMLAQLALAGSTGNALPGDFSGYVTVAATQTFTVGSSAPH